MFKFNAFYQDDKVTYVGHRWAKELAGKMGWVIGRISNEEDKYVVEFEGDSYIMPLQSITKFTASSVRDAGPEIRQIRKRSSDDEPGSNLVKRGKYSAGQK